MKNSFNKTIPIQLKKVALLLLTVSSMAQLTNAATDTWNGGSTGSMTNWSDPNNWGGITLANNDFLIFSGLTRTVTSNDFSSLTIGNIAFASGANSFTNTGNSFTLTNQAGIGDGNVGGGSITNFSANDQVFSNGITISAGNHFITTASGSGKLVFRGPITRNPGSVVIFTNFGGSIDLSASGLTTNAAQILGGWALMGSVYGATNSGSLNEAIVGWATLSATKLVIPLPIANYTIVSHLTPGPLIPNTDANANVKITTNTVYLGAGTTTINTLMWGPTNTASAGTIALGTGTNLVLGANGAIVNLDGSVPAKNLVLTIGTTAGNGTITCGSSGVGGEIALINDSFGASTKSINNDIALNSSITDNGSGPVDVVVDGYIQFNAPNSHSGGTYINEGRAQVSGANVFGYGSVYVYPGGQIFMNSGTITNICYLSGVGYNESGNDGFGAIRINGKTWSGPMVLNGTTAIGGSGTISGQISGIGSLIAGTGASATGSGTLTVGSVNGANTYLGDTVIGPPTNADYSTVALTTCTLKIASGLNNVMPNGSGYGNVILNAPTIGGATNAIFDLNGTAQAINGLFSTAISPANNDLVQSSTSGGVLTVGADNGNSTFGGILQNGAGSLALTKIGNGTFTLTNANTYTGNTTIGAGTLALTGIGSLSASSSVVVSNGTFSVSGLAGNYTTASTISITNGALALGNKQVMALNTLNATNSTLSLVATIGSTNLTVGNLNTDGTTNNIVINSIGNIPQSPTYPIIVTLIKYTTASFGNNGFNFGATSLPAQTTGYIYNDIANSSVDLVLTQVPLAVLPVSWAGLANGNWDSLVTTNWVLSSDDATPYFYQDGEAVTFNDSAPGTTSVNLTGTFSPGSLTISNAALAYTFSGNGSLSGASGIIKTNSGVATLAETGGDNFSGGVTVGGGTLVLSNVNVSIAGGYTNAGGSLIDMHSGAVAGGLNAKAGSTVLDGAGSMSGNTAIANSAIVQVGNNDTLGNLPSGSISDSGTLNLNKTNSYVVANAISGSGLLNINPGNTNAVIILSGTSAGYTGPITVSSGTLQLNNNAALGGTPGGTTNMTVITNGATLDVGGASFAANGANLTNIWVYISGNGVTGNSGGSGTLINSGSLAQQNALRHVVLTADATVGGPGNFIASGDPGRVDIRGTGASLSTGGNAYNLTKVGANQFTIVAATVDPALGNIDVEGGQLGIETGTTSLGNPAANLIIRAGSCIELFNTFVSQTSFALNKQFIFYGDGVDTNVMVNSGGIYGTWSNTFIGPVFLTNGDTVVAGGSGNPCGILFSNIVGGPGGFIVGGTRVNFTNYFATNNTYTGNTTIKIGTLALVGNGSISFSPNIIINSNAIFDVSAVLNTPYPIITGQTLQNLNVGAAGTIVGGLTVNSGAALALNYTNGLPALTITGGALTLNDNAVTVTVSGTALSGGSYKLISAGAGGSVVGSVASSSVTVNGAGAAGSTLLSISANELYLVVKSTPSFSSLSGSPSITYGTSSITLNGNVSTAGPIYPAAGETVSATINGHTVNGLVTDNSGDFSIIYNDASLTADGVSGSPYTITYSYAGDASLVSANDTSTALTVNQASLSVTANNDNKTYGQIKTYGAGSTAFTSSGLQNGEAIGSVTITASGGTAATDSVGSYNLTPSAATGGTFNANNYSITYDAGALTVNPLAVSLTGTRAYDGTTNAVAAILSVANKVGSDDVAIASGTGGLAGATVGVQAITSFGDLTIGGTTAGNYTLLGAGGSVMITQAAPAIVIGSSENPSGYKDSISFTATLPEDATGSVNFKTNGILFDTESLSGGSAASVATTLLPRGTNVISVEYSGDANYSANTNSLNQIVTNHPPVIANIVTNDAPANLTFKIAVSDLASAAGWSDVDGDTITLSAVDASSADSVSMTQDGTYIYYNAPVIAEDHFGYTVTDGTDTASSTVYIEPTNMTYNINSTVVNVDGSVTLSGEGALGHTNVVQRTDNLTPPIIWTPVGTNAIDNTGHWQFTDPSPTDPTFYRSIIEP